MGAQARELGPLEKRASHITGNPKLYDVVQDMARAVDRLVIDSAETHVKLDEILYLLRAHGNNGRSAS